MRCKLSAVLALVFVWMGMDAWQCTQAAEQAEASQATAARSQFSVPGPVADSFPHFSVPGEPRLERLRELFYLHYRLALRPRSHAMFALPWIPKSTLWASPKRPGEDKADAQAYWQRILASRRIDDAGYVSCHQHPGMGHSEGWPFPLWTQVDGIGWHFSLARFRRFYEIPEATSVEDWTLRGAVSERIDPVRGWSLSLTDNTALLETPRFRVRTEVAPIIRLDWETQGLGADAKVFLEWTTEQEPEFNFERSIAISPRTKPGLGNTEAFVHTMPNWKGIITQLRLRFENASGASITVREMFTAMDTRHNVNNAIFIQACDDTIRWSGDLDFLREVIGPMRKATAYMIDEFGTREHRCVFTRWPGHDGLSGITYAADGKKSLYPGRGVGGNYFDLMPFGGRDALATVYMYDALRRMATLEDHIAAHPDWELPPALAGLTGKDLARHAAEIKQHAGQLFWNEETGRLVGAIDVENQSHDYGFTFLNLEAVYYGFTTPEQTTSIVDWITGKRQVEGDTSQGDDIYRWRFGPRATTRRNIDYYQSMWHSPESIPWGYQIQDGGAVLGFTYFDLMARLKQFGPDDAWKRLQEIVAWQEEVQQAGGYRKYYGGEGQEERGSLQGCGTPGGIGVDCEFMESVLAPQVMLYGFLGLQPQLDSLAIKPRLPSDWPELTITQIHFHKHLLDITVSGRTASDQAGSDQAGSDQAGSDQAESDQNILLHSKGDYRGTLDLLVQSGQWQVRYLDAEGQPVGEPTVVSVSAEQLAVPVDFRIAPQVELRFLPNK